MSDRTGGFTIFISSTYADLVEYREAVHAAIRRLRHHAEDMIYWSADERTASRVSAENVKAADLVILILAHRYGSLANGDTRSFTHIEYDTAREAGIPIFAFFLAPEFPWPPPAMELEADQRERLALFRRRVESECVRHFFTTPESLAMLVTQAIANFDRRTGGSVAPGKASELTIWPVKPRTDLMNHPDCGVQVRTAEDGLPLIAAVRRARDLNRTLEVAANLLERDLGDSSLDSVCEVLRTEGRKVWRNRGLCEVRMSNGQTARCYVSFNSLSRLFAPSLLTRVLVLPHRADGRPPALLDRDDETKTTIEADRQDGVRVQSVGGQNRFLAVAIDSEEVFTVGWPDVGTRFRDAPVQWRPFLSESLSGFPDCRVAITARDEHTKAEHQACACALGEYPEALRRLMLSNPHPKHVTFLPTFSVSRQGVARVIQGTARALGALHRTGTVHGDLKPANVLLARDGPVPIDSLGLKFGQLTPAVSPGWAAPEQILLQPVCANTDLYPLGVMLVSLLDGALTGERATYVIPAPNTRDGFPIQFFRNPRVYLDPKGPLPRPSRLAWLAFVERCLRFDPAERPDGVAAFADEMDRLLAAHPLEGALRVSFSNRPLVFARLPDGTESACRVVTDDWADFYKQGLWRR